MITSVDVIKAFEKLQCLFLMKTLSKQGSEGNFLNLIKFIYEQPSANIILYAEIFNAFSLPPNQERDKDVCPHHFYSSLYRKLAIPTRQEKKRQTEKVEEQLSFLMDDTIICRGRLMEFIKKATRISEFRLQNTSSAYKNLL